MSIISEHQDIFGKAETTRLTRLTHELAELVATMHDRLGKQSYLLDQNISMFLDAANATLLYTAVEDGFSAAGEFRELCQSVMDGKTDYAEHPLYEQVKEYITSHPLTFQEASTKQELYYIALADDFLEYATMEYQKTLKEEQQAVLDIVELRVLCKKITSVLGSDLQMNRLQLMLKQKYLYVTPMAGFVQDFTNDLLYCLIHRDAETSKLAVLLWLENMEGSK